MLSSWRHFATALALPVIFATACTSAPETDAAGGEDEINYRSTAGQEYALSADVSFTLSAETQALQGAEREAAILAQAQTLRDSVLSTISSELDKLWPEEERISNAGVAIQYRQSSATLSDLKELPDGSGYGLTVSGEFAGIKDLERRLPMRTEGDKTFLPISANLGAVAQELRVFITPVERSLNAYPKYLELFEDGLDISAHFGGDHNDPPQDINHARSLYDDLLASGFRSPVARFEDLKIDSGPLTSSIKVKGEVVPVRINIFHVDMSTPETRDLVVNAYKGAMKNADVVIYDGHAGRRLDYSGVVLAYKPARSSITANEFKSIEASTKQQVYLFNGCETYTGYADKLYENPAKNPENTDVITTGNYSAIQRKANQVISFIHSFIDQKNGNWIPRSYDSMLGRMNDVGERSWVHIYGVHGLDDNPKASPLADVSKVGVACRQDSECGAPDSKCMVVSSTTKVCGIACADTKGCPSGTACVLPRGRTSADDQQCSPQ